MRCYLVSIQDVLQRSTSEFYQFLLQELHNLLVHCMCYLKLLVVVVVVVVDSLSLILNLNFL